MANIRSCNKHNMIACVEKTAQNADFYQVIDFLTGCSINYSLLVDPDLIGPWLQQFWGLTVTLQVIHDSPSHIRANGKYLIHVITYTALSPKNTSMESRLRYQHRLCPSRSSNKSKVQFFFVDTEWNARTYFKWYCSVTRYCFSTWCCFLPVLLTIKAETAELQRTADFQVTGSSRDQKQTLSQLNKNTQAQSPSSRNSLPNLSCLSDGTKKLILRREGLLLICKEWSNRRIDLENNSKYYLTGAEVLVSISSPTRFEHSFWVHTSQPKPANSRYDTQRTDPKDKGKGILVEEPKRKEMTLFNKSVALGNKQMMRRLLEKFKLNGTAEVERKERQDKGDVEGKSVTKTLKGRGKLQLLKHGHSNEPKLRSEVSIDVL
ncbi:hypothetical protein Tco_1493192 [Tanacetum coccineum]